MRNGFAAVIALLIVAAWQYRNNRPVFFSVVGTMFAAAALLVSGSHLPERILESLALAWLACMVIAAAFGAAELVRYLKKKRKLVLTQSGKGRNS